MPGTHTPTSANKSSTESGGCSEKNNSDNKDERVKEETKTENKQDGVSLS